MDNLFTSAAPNRKVAISRYNHIPHEIVPLRIAPAPVKKVDSGGGGLRLFKRDENAKGSEKSGTKVFVEIRRKSTGEEKGNGNGVKNDDDKVESGKEGQVEKEKEGEDKGEGGQDDGARDVEKDVEAEKLRRGLRSMSVRKKYN
jgi:hypothetical protein